jgi:GrpB-like predicted nucleotidyltransferase (UPF0157 family)
MPEIGLLVGWRPWGHKTGHRSGRSTWLRQSADDRDAYAALKIELQGQGWETMNHHADAKTTFIGDDGPG